MKDKIALWGTDEHDNDILIALRLRVDDNCVDVWTFPKSQLDIPAADAMVQDWEKIDPDNLPQPHTHIQQDMGQPSLLPEHIRTKNTDVISRAEKEWFVRVLSTKLKAKLNAEIEQLQAQTEALTDYDKEVWDLAQSYWQKINLHFQSRDLNRDDASSLRDRINACFAKLKSLRKEDNAKFDQEAKANAIMLQVELDRLTTQINNKRNNLSDVFEDLKKLQIRSQQVRISKELRNEIREKIDAAFEALRNERKKERSSRHNARINGLKDVISKMEKSLAIDENELKFQQSRMGQIGGQLEMQLREAKIQMVKSRVDAKVEKLNDMKATLQQVEAEMERELKREEAVANKSKEIKSRAEKADKKDEKPTANNSSDESHTLSATIVANDATAEITETAQPDNTETTTNVAEEAKEATPDNATDIPPIEPTPDNNIAELGEELADNL
jgi:chromosome segregation ATPase